MSLQKRDTMTPKQVMRWLLEFGSGWVKTDKMFATWADVQLSWQKLHINGFLEKRDDVNMFERQYRLTDKAKALIKEKVNEH